MLKKVIILIDKQFTICNTYLINSQQWGFYRRKIKEDRIMQLQEIQSRLSENGIELPIYTDSINLRLRLILNCIKKSLLNKQYQKIGFFLLSIIREFIPFRY